MATAAIAKTNFDLGSDPAGIEVRIWGMDQDDKPFIQSALARHITDKGALLTGVLPVKMGDVVGVRYLERKARFKITWLSDQDSSQTRSVGIDCVEGVNIWGVRQPIPIEATSTLYSESKIRAGEAPPNRRKAERYPCRFAADANLDGSMVKVHVSVTDISLKGCYLQMVSPFPVGSRLTVNLYGMEAKSEGLGLRGIVKTSHPMVGMGVQFEVPRIEQRQRLIDLLGPTGSSEKSCTTRMPAISEEQEIEELPLAVEVPSLREMVERLMVETKRLEAESRESGASTVTDEVRQAAVHLKAALHLCA
jgi:hypothetical protein